MNGNWASHDWRRQPEKERGKPQRVPSDHIVLHKNPDEFSSNYAVRPAVTVCATGGRASHRQLKAAALLHLVRRWGDRHRFRVGRHARRGFAIAVSHERRTPVLRIPYFRQAIRLLDPF